MTDKPESHRVTGVLPTYNRAAALRTSLPRFLSLRNLDRIVVVDDASSDDTSTVLAALASPRLTVARHDVNRGQAAARNTGVRSANTEWVLFLEDDCGVPESYADRLLEAADSAEADVVGAPWLHADQSHFAEAFRAARTRRTSRLRLQSHPSTFPADVVETPFMPALALVRRSVFDEITYNEGYRGNGWREETSFFVRAARAGFRCVLTPETASYQLGQWGGGARAPWARYELSAVRNNWRFLQEHGEWLAQGGHIDGVLQEQLSFVLGRRASLAGHLRSKAAVVRRRLPGRLR